MQGHAVQQQKQKKVVIEDKDPSDIDVMDQQREDLSSSNDF